MKHGPLFVLLTSFAFLGAFGERGHAKESNASPSFINACKALLSTNPNPNALSRAQLYIEKAKLTQDKLKFANDFYGPKGQALFEALNTLGPAFAELAVDPGIALRLEDFRRFVIARKLQGQDPWQVRESFSHSLGNKTLYRAITTTPAQREEILREGMLSRVLRGRGFIYNLMNLSVEYDNPQTLPLNMTMRDHVKPDQSLTSDFLYPIDPLLSVTDYADLATAVAFYALGNPRKGAVEPGQVVYLATLSVPVLDLIEASPDLGIDYVNEPGKRTSFEVHSPGGRAEKIDDAKALESFVYLKLDANEIVSFVPVPAKKIGYIKMSGYDDKGVYSEGCMGNCPSNLVGKVKSFFARFRKNN